MTKTSKKVEYQSLPLIECLARMGRRAAAASMATGDLRPRHIIALKLLSEHGAVSQQVLGEALSLDPSNVVGLLNELEDKGLTTRRRDPADRRRHIVELSRDGEVKLEEAYTLLATVEDEMLRALSLEERAMLYQLLIRAVGTEKSLHNDEI